METGHNYKFSMPSMPWKFCECPKCHGSGTSFNSALDGDFIICDLCGGEGETVVWKANAWLTEAAKRFREAAANLEELQKIIAPFVPKEIRGTDSTAGKWRDTTGLVPIEHKDKKEHNESG